jgi:phosphoribosyl-ATP pyrophosphohydrolase/phosphoribosyl-AMP cyclohydrolase
MNIDYNKNNGLVPAIIQDASTHKVLMLGYMNDEAVKKTIETTLVTFFSRTKQRLWTKGEESGNVLNFVGMKLDCDSDTLLVQVNPQGPTCHKGSDTCWNDDNTQSFGFLSDLETVIENRKNNATEDPSYIASLFAKGINKIAQKVGEEAVEVVIEAKDNDDKLFLDESADLLFHYMILLQGRCFKKSSEIKSKPSQL